MAKDVAIVDSERERFFCSHYGSAGSSNQILARSSHVGYIENRTHVHFHVDKAGDSLFIPSNTLIFQREGPQVGVVTAEGKVLLRKIQIAQNLGAELEIVRPFS
jgi:hypothetical protein